jgi:release factor glutamine methyltransferase
LEKPQYGETIGRILSEARRILASYDIESPALESELLLRYVLDMDRVQLLIEYDSRIEPGAEQLFWRIIERRLKNEPAAYIMGHREFYGLDFYVNQNVLIPRPETESLVDKALEFIKDHSPCIVADIGTGSGAIAVSVAVAIRNTVRPADVKIYATDISAAALEVTSINCRRHGVADRVHLLQGDLLEPLPEPVDLIATNLPYVSRPELEKVNTFGFEPVQALDGGPDGLDIIRRLCAQLPGKLNTGGSLLLEIGQCQAEAVTVNLRNLFPSALIEVIPDLAGVGRVAIMSF